MKAIFTNLDALEQPFLNDVGIYTFPIDFMLNSNKYDHFTVQNFTYDPDAYIWFDKEVKIGFWQIYPVRYNVVPQDYRVTGCRIFTIPAGNWYINTLNTYIIQQLTLLLSKTFSQLDNYTTDFDYQSAIAGAFTPLNGSYSAVGKTDIIAGIDGFKYYTLGSSNAPTSVSQGEMLRDLRIEFQYDGILDLNPLWALFGLPFYENVPSNTNPNFEGFRTPQEIHDAYIRVGVDGAEQNYFIARQPPFTETFPNPEVDYGFKYQLKGFRATKDFGSLQQLFIQCDNISGNSMTYFSGKKNALVNYIHSSSNLKNINKQFVITDSASNSQMPFGIAENLSTITFRITDRYNRIIKFARTAPWTLYLQFYHSQQPEEASNDCLNSLVRKELITSLDVPERDRGIFLQPARRIIKK